MRGEGEGGEGMGREGKGERERVQSLGGQCETTEIPKMRASFDLMRERG